MIWWLKDLKIVMKKNQFMKEPFKYWLAENWEWKRPSLIPCHDFSILWVDIKLKFTFCRYIEFLSINPYFCVSLTGYFLNLMISSSLLDFKRYYALEVKMPINTSFWVVLTCKLPKKCNGNQTYLKRKEIRML